RAKGGDSTKMRPALPGAAMVALMSRAPVVPVAITGSNVALPGVFFQWALRRRPHILVRFGEPFILGEGTTDARTAEVAADMMMRRIAALLPEANRGVYGAETAGQVIVRRQPRGPGEEE